MICTGVALNVAEGVKYIISDIVCMEALNLHFRNILVNQTVILESSLTHVGVYTENCTD